jgi:hypothetical protein
MLRKLIRFIALLVFTSLATGVVEADISENHSHLRFMQLVADSQAAAVTLEDGRIVLTNLTPGTVSDYMLYYVNRSSFLTVGVTPVEGVSQMRTWVVPPLSPGYHTAALVGSSLDNSLELIFIHEDSVCAGELEIGSCVVMVNNMQGSPPLIFMADGFPVIDDSRYRHVIVNSVEAGTYQDFTAVDLTRPETTVFDQGTGFFEPNVIYFYALTGNYPGQKDFDYSLGITRRVPVDMMTFLRGLTADLQLTDGERLFATENIVALLETTGFDELLSNEQQALTVFAPTDAAVLEVDAELYNCAMSNPLAMRALILNHVLVGVQTSASLIELGVVPTMAGTIHTFQAADGGFFIDDKVRVFDSLGYPTVNGNVYLIDTVLVPEGFEADFCELG